MKLDWTTFKSVVDGRGLSIQWLDVDGHYWLKAIDGPFSIEHVMSKVSPASSDQTDFETNYKDDGNVSPKAHIVQKLANADLSASGQCTSFTAPANATTSFYWAIPSDVIAALGGTFFSVQSVMQDMIKVEIVAGNPAVVVLATPVPNWSLYPNHPINFEDVDIAALPTEAEVGGMTRYFKFTYTNSQVAQSVFAVVNMRLYKAG